MFNHFQTKKYKKLIETNNFDEEKEVFLNQLIDEIELFNKNIGKLPASCINHN